MAFNIFEPYTFFNLDPVWQFIISVIYVSEGFFFAILALLIKKRIKWGIINFERFTGVLWVSFFIFCGVFYFSRNMELLIIILTFTWALWIGGWFSVIVFNNSNKDMINLQLQKWEFLADQVTELNFIVYKESHNKRVAVALNEENREPFINLLKRIFGKKRYITIRNDAAPFKLNKTGEIYLYRQVYRHKKTKNLEVLVEPNIKTHSVQAFVKAWEGNASQANLVEIQDEEIVILRMQRDLIAKIHSLRRLEEFVKNYLPEEYPSYKTEMNKAIEFHKKEISDYDDNLKEKLKIKEENLKELEKVTEDELYEEDYDILY